MNAVIASLAVSLVTVAGCAASPSTLTVSSVAIASPTPAETTRLSPPDTGPVDALTAEFQSAQAGGPSAQLDFVACVAGGVEALQFSTLFGAMAELALATSGVDEEEFWSSMGVTLDQFAAAERRRAADAATVDVSMRLKITPDTAALRQLMRANLEERDEPVDDAAIDAILGRVVGRMTFDQMVQNDVTARLVGGSWHACGLPIESPGS